MWSVPSLMVSRGLYDPDAAAFIDATQITDRSIKTAINKLTEKAKENGWWNKCQAIYPMAGDGISQAYSYQYQFNLKDARDSDDAFRLTFNGSCVFASTGVTSDGATGYADTHLIPSVNQTPDDKHLSFYSRTNLDANVFDMGSIQSSPVSTDYIRSRVANNFFGTIGRWGISGANTSSLGWYLASRISDTDVSIYKSGTLRGTETSANTANLSVYNVVICAVYSNGSVNAFSLRECAFATIGSGISNALQSLMYTDIQAFQTALGRQV